MVFTRSQTALTLPASFPPQDPLAQPLGFLTPLSCLNSPPPPLTPGLKQASALGKQSHPSLMKPRTERDPSVLRLLLQFQPQTREMIQRARSNQLASPPRLLTLEGRRIFWCLVIAISPATVTSTCRATLTSS